MKSEFFKITNQSAAKEAGDLFKNEASSKSLTSRGEWKLNILLILFILTACNKAVNINKEELPNYIAIENFGEQFEFAILGLDGIGYFYEFQEDNFMPKRLTI